MPSITFFDKKVYEQNILFSRKKTFKSKDIFMEDIWVRPGSAMGKRVAATLCFVSQLRDGGWRGVAYVSPSMYNEHNLL